MADYKHSFKDFDKEHMARVVGLNLGISTKHSIEICSAIRGKNLQKAKGFLESIANKKTALGLTRFKGDVGHKTKIGPGRYPVKASTEILGLLNSLETNAQNKGLNTSTLVLIHVCAQRGSGQWHFGRWRRRQMKRTHIEIVAQEVAPKKEAKKEEKPKLSKAQLGPNSAKQNFGFEEKPKLEEKPEIEKQEKEKQKIKGEKKND